MATPADQKAQLQARMNAQFLRFAAEQPIKANAQNGNTYAVGQTLNFDVPVMAGAFVTKIRVYYNVSFNYTAAGSGPTVSVNAGGPYNLFTDISTSFGNPQVSTHPYICKILSQLRGYNRTHMGQVLGTESTNIQAQLYAQPAVAAGSNTWKGYYDLPTQLVHPLSPFGLIPVGGSGTRMQIQLTAANAFTGADPLNNVINTNGTIDTVTGTITVVVFYKDFHSFASPAAMQMDLTNLPTSQLIRLRDITNLSTGTPYYLSITNPYSFNKLISIVIDGQSSSTFCAADNISLYRIDGAENTSSGIRVYDSVSGGMVNYYSRIRDIYGQDLDDGVLVYNANGENVTNASMQDGEMWLNCAQNGYPAARAGFQVGAVSSANSISPRVVTFGVIINPVGIQ